MTASRTSVVICAHTLDRWQELLDAVASVLAQEPPPREVVVVVDGNDELLARARQELRGVTVVPNDDVQGLSGARMTGARLASGELLAFLDDDAVAAPGWLAELEAGFADPAVLGVGGRVEPLWRVPRPAWLPDELLWVVGCTWAGMQHPQGRIRGPIGANMGIRADVLRRAGSFAPELGRIQVGRTFIGTADETELAIRTRTLSPGGWWAYRPGALVRHTVTPQRATWSYLVRRSRMEGAAKAVLVELAGARDGLGAERAYLRSVLPRAVVRELRTALCGRPHALARVAAIVTAVAVTGWTYARLRLTRAWARRRARARSTR